MFFWILSIVGLLLVFAISYCYLNHKSNNYWSIRGVKSPKRFPILGNLFEIRFNGQFNVEREWFKKYGKIYGIHMFHNPVLTVVDNVLIKQILVKDFHVFVNRDENPFDHEIWSCNLFTSEDEQWKRIRSITSPSFSSGKLRAMHSMMDQCVCKLVDYLEEIIDTKNGRFDAKEVITRFTINVIASTSYATDTNEIYDQTKKNPFVANAQNYLNSVY